MERLFSLLTCFRTTKEEREFNKELRDKGLEIAIEQCLNKINQLISSEEIARKFILQELDFAQKEELLPQNFIINSGFNPVEYEGALEEFSENKEELLNLQILLENLLNKITQKEEIIYISIKVIDQVMKEWKIGKYKQINDEKKIEKAVQEEIPSAVIQYDVQKVNELMEEYSDIIGDIIMGTTTPNEEERTEDFKNHISQAGIEGKSPHALILSCFYEHKKPYNQQLPISINQLDETALSFLKSILKGFSSQGFSPAFITYKENHPHEIYNLLKN